jgi:hypothetical protein
MNLPAQLRDQVEAANKLREQAYGEEAATSESTATESQEPAATQEAAPAAASTENVQQQEKPATQAEDENNPTYAQRWRSLQGVINSRDQRISNLEQLVATMQAAPPAREIKAPEATKLVTDKDESEYGSDMVDFARRVTREEMTPVMQALAQMQQQLQQLNGLAPAVQQVATKQQATSEEQFFGRLSQHVPDWAAVNDDTRFHAWLLDMDSMTGITRQTYLMDAQRNLDLQRVVSIFNAWKREAGVPSANSEQQPARNQSASQLEKQVAPGRANAATVAPQAKAEKVYARADITKFFEDKRNGKYKGREAEANATERDIFKAQGEGRIAA